MMTKKQRQKLLVDHNIQQSKTLINQAERANKGRYAHDINVCMLRIKDLLKKKSPKTTRGKSFIELCKYKQALASYLYLAEKKL